MCLYPKLIQNKKYTSNKKNSGIIPAIVDNRVLLVPVGCGKCMECRKQKAREWQVRLLEDVRHEKNGKFVTLTFSDKSIAELSNEIEGLEGYDLDNQIATIAVRRFLERWRKKFKKSVRHWLVTELGHNGTENIHIHGIIYTNESRETLANLWKYGFIYPRNDKEWKNNFVTEKTVNYITKYVNKIDEKHKEYKSKILTSAGIGRGYTTRADANNNKYKAENTDESYRTRTGHKIALPIYYRNKIYSEEEREALWIQKLDKEERWICGERIDVSENEKEYYQVLEHYRLKNKKLGYGDDSKDWNRKAYEKKQRFLKQQERIKKGGGLGEDSKKSKDSGAGRVHPTDVERGSALNPNEENFLKNLED